MLKRNPAAERRECLLRDLHHRQKTVRDQLPEIHSAADDIPEMCMRTVGDDLEIGELLEQGLTISCEDDVRECLIGP